MVVGDSGSPPKRTTHQNQLKKTHAPAEEALLLWAQLESVVIA